MSNVRVKVYHQDQIRRFTITTTTDFKSFISIVEEFYPNISEQETPPVFKYEDEEGEYITFSTEIEWKEALKQNLDVLRITIENEKKCQKPEKCKRSKDKYDLKLKPGDLVYELSEREVKDYLRSGELTIQVPSGHVNIVCDGCDKSGFSGTRFHCLDCKDFDFCEKCHKHFGEKHFGGGHKFEKIPDLKDKHFGDVVAHFVHEKDQEKEDRRLAKKIHREERALQKDLKKKEKKEEKELKKHVKVEKKQEKEEKKQEKKEEVKVIPLYPKVEDKVVEKAPVFEIVQPTAPKEDVKSVSPVIKPVSPVGKPVSPVVRDEKYSIHYKILENMGFAVSDVTTTLLKKHNGNLQKVVDDMLNQ